VCLAEEKVPKTQLLGLFLQFSDDRENGLPPELGILRQLRVGNWQSRKDFLLIQLSRIHTTGQSTAGRTSRNRMSFSRVSFANGENLSSIYAILVGPGSGIKVKTYECPRGLRGIRDDRMRHGVCCVIVVVQSKRRRRAFNRSRVPRNPGTATSIAGSGEHQQVTSDL